MSERETRCVCTVRLTVVIARGRDMADLIYKIRSG
jgi:hypothetical protein